jgi:hypothetical protein
MKESQMRYLPLVVIVAAVACASGSTASDVAEITAGEPFRLGVGEAARQPAEDLTVRFVAVAGDSRCPTGVQCFWEGDAEVELKVTRGEEESSVSLHTHGGKDYPRQAQALGCILSLEDLEPHPKAGVQIAPEDYVATLELSLEVARESDE